MVEQEPHGVFSNWKKKPSDNEITLRLRAALEKITDDSMTLTDIKELARKTLKEYYGTRK